jgi:hypothetical protein
MSGDEASGWTLLPDVRGARVHRPDPDRDGVTLCGRPVDPMVPVHRDNPGFDPCEACAALADPVAAGDVAEQPAISSAKDPEIWPAGLVRTWEASGWVRLDGSWAAHRPHPKRAPGWTMCGQKRLADVPECAPCREELHRARVAAGIVMETVRVTDPEQVDRLDRARARGVSIRTMRGGLPTLGRDR